LKAAKVMLAAEMTDTCVIACYYAVFWAAIAMLHYVGITEAADGGMVILRTAFGLECVKRRKLCPARVRCSCWVTFITCVPKPCYTNWRQLR